MATWVRLGTGTAPSSTDANLTGTYELDNGTAPGDFDETAVNSVRIEFTITGTSFVDDTWNNPQNAWLTLNGQGSSIAIVSGTGDNGLGNVASDTDETDSTISGGFTVAQWEGAEINEASGGGYTLWIQEMMPDGGNMVMSALTVTIDYDPLGGDQTITGVLFTKAPTFPGGNLTFEIVAPATFLRAPTFITGQVDFRLLGALFPRAPTFAAGEINLRINGVLFARAPTFPTGSITGEGTQDDQPIPFRMVGATGNVRRGQFRGVVAVSGDQTITGVLFTKAPTFFAGLVTQEIVGTATFTRAPTFPTGQVNFQVNGVLFERAPTFATGLVSLRILGVTFTRAPTFPIGFVNVQQTIAGVLFTRAPTFPAGQVNLRIVGVLFTRAPTFPTGLVNVEQTIAGVLFTRAPTFPTGLITQEVVGTATFTKAPVFPTGLVNVQQTIAGVLFVRVPSFAGGNVNLRIVGLTFQRAPTFPTGVVKVTQTITGVLFTKAPTFPTGLVTISVEGTATFQRAPTFLTGQVNLRLLGSLLTRAPSFAGGQIDFRILGQLFAKAPTFPQGQVTQATLITGVSVFAKAPTFPSGRVNLRIVGTLFQRVPSFPVGLVTQEIVGTATFTKAPTFPTGQVNFQINGSLFTRAPTFPLGFVNVQQTITGVLFTKAPTFPTGLVNVQQTITGVLFARAPTFPTGLITLGVTGTATFTKAPTFPTGQVNFQINGAVFQRAPSFAGGQVNLRIVGSTFTRAPTFFVGELQQGQTISGVLFAKAPTFPAGQVNLRIVGATFQRSPTFLAGTVVLGGLISGVTPLQVAPTFPLGQVNLRIFGLGSGIPGPNIDTDSAAYTVTTGGTSVKTFNLPPGLEVGRKLLLVCWTNVNGRITLEIPNINDGSATAFTLIETGTEQFSEPYIYHYTIQAADVGHTTGRFEANSNGEWVIGAMWIGDVDLSSAEAQSGTAFEDDRTQVWGYNGTVDTGDTDEKLFFTMWLGSRADVTIDEAGGDFDFNGWNDEDDDGDLPAVIGFGSYGFSYIVSNDQVFHPNEAAGSPSPIVGSYGADGDTISLFFWMDTQDDANWPPGGLARAPVFPTGTVTIAPPTQIIDGVLFAKAPTFPQGQTNFKVFGPRTLALPGVVGQHATTPSGFSPTYHLSGDELTIAFRGTSDEWARELGTTEGEQTILSTWDGVSKGYRFYVDNQGNFVINWGDGTGARRSSGLRSNMFEPTVDGEPATVRVRFDGAAGTAKFDEWLANTWVQFDIGIAVPIASGSPNTGQDLMLGRYTPSDARHFIGDIHWAEVREGPTDPVVTRFDADLFAIGDSNTTKRVDIAGHIWTLIGEQVDIVSCHFTRKPTFPTGAMQPGDRTISGNLFAISPTFAVGAIYQLLEHVARPPAQVDVAQPPDQVGTKNTSSKVTLTEGHAHVDVDE